LFVCSVLQHTEENSTGTKHKWNTWWVWPRKKGSEPKKQRNRILKRMKINTWRILHTWRWPCSERLWKPTYSKAGRRRRHNLRYPLTKTYRLTVSRRVSAVSADECRNNTLRAVLSHVVLQAHFLGHSIWLPLLFNLSGNVVEGEYI
jgi:hypothetical protein